MIKTYNILSFSKASKKIEEPITKFGGQPIWIGEEQWPVSSGWKNRKMMFVGQIAVTKNMLGNIEGFVAYIFVTHPENCDDLFFDPDVIDWNGGENAVVIQTYENKCVGRRFSDGPTVFDEKNEQYEYIPILKEGYDPDFLTSDEYRKLNTEQRDKYFNAIDTNKIGGTPNFFREDAWPKGEWILLLQLKCNFLPFVLRLGSMPVMYVFITKDFKRAGLLIQN